jgi:regulator of sigma E protease
VIVTPRAEPLENEEPVMSDYQNVPSLGLCYFIQPKVVSVEPGSAGAKAGIRKEHFLTRVKLVLPSDEKSVEKGSFLGSVMQSFRGKSTDQEDNSNTYLIASEPNSGPDPTFPDLEKITVMQLQRLLDYRPIQELEFSIAIVENKLKVKPEPSGSLFLQDRGLLQYRQVKDLPPQPYGVCLSRAVKDIPDSIRQVIGTIRSLISQRVSKKLLGGPVTIATTAYATASEGLGTFLKFLGMLSINLAVMNFLPIPPLDGGQMCFLIGEKIKGSPLPERVQVGFTMLGLSAVLSLMVVVLYQDFMRIFGLL